MMRIGLPHLCAMTAFLVAIGLIAWRITLGVDLSDESYYALFLHDWLIGGIGESQNISLHQTAAILVYPLALAYQLVTAGTEGLFLFLRAVYLGGALSASVLMAVALSYAGYGVRGWFAGLIVLSFIPYGLPAPSYNTIGLQGLIVGLSAMLLFSQSKRRGWVLLSGFGWALAIIAYPPLSG